MRLPPPPPGEDCSIFILEKRSPWATGLFRLQLGVATEGGSPRVFGGWGCRTRDPGTPCCSPKADLGRKARRLSAQISVGFHGHGVGKAARVEGYKVPSRIGEVWKEVSEKTNKLPNPQR